MAAAAGGQCDVVAARVRINAATELRVAAQSLNGRCLLHIREYILGDDNSFVPTPKGVAPPIEKLDDVLEGVRELRAAGSEVGVYATIPMSRGNEIRFSIQTFQGTTKFDIRNYFTESKSGEMMPTKKGIRENLGLLPELERGLEALDRAING